MKKAEGAKTAQEFKEKYTRKRYNSRNIGIALVAIRLYDLLLRKEGLPQDEQLFSKQTNIKHAQIRSEMTKEENALYRNYNYMLNLCWTEFRYAVAIRNLVLRELHMLIYLLADTMTAEALISTNKDKGIDLEITQQFRDNLSLLSFREGERRDQSYRNLKNSIEPELKYLVMYNTFIEIVADVYRIPEMTMLKVNVDNVNDELAETKSITNDIREKAIARDPATEILNMKFFDIQPAPPVPNELVKRLSSDLKTYMRPEDCLMNLMECYYNGKGIEAYSYG